jgi:hypothetical protein
MDCLGLTDPERLERRLAGLSESDAEELRFFFLDMARSTPDCLADGQTLAGRAAIWAGDAGPAAIAGATLLWADHYLVTDRAAELMISTPRPAAFAAELRGLLALRPLIETGMVVPVMKDAAAMAALYATRARTETDLRTLLIRGFGGSSPWRRTRRSSRFGEA